MATSKLSKVKFKKMRILLVLDEYRRSDSIGGGDVIAQQIATGLIAKGHTVEVCCNWGIHSEKNSDIKEFRSLCPKYVWKRAGFAGFYRHVLADRIRINSVLSRFAPDVIYCLHQRGIAVPTISFFNSLKIPLVYRMGDEWLRLHYYADKYDVTTKWTNRRYRTVKTLVMRLSHLFCSQHGLFKRPMLKTRWIAFNSHDLKQRVSPLLDGDVIPWIIKNGVDLESFKFWQRNFEKPLRILYLGRIVKQKGVHLLPEMLKHIRTNSLLKDSTLTIVGWSTDNEYIGQLQDSVSRLGLCSSIRFMGVVSRNAIPQLYNKHSILVFPSLMRPSKYTVEGCPSVLVEALASGLPIVARLTPGLNEIVKDGTTCLGVYEDSPKALAETVTRLCTNRELYQRLSTQGRVQAELEHSLTDMITKTEDMLSQAMEAFTHNDFNC